MQLINEEVEILRREESKPCISIIIPLHLPQEAKADKIHISKVIKAAAELITTRFPEQAAVLIDSLNTLVKEINFDRNQEGIGLYVSVNFRYQTFFPFPVTEKIIVEEKFHLRDILYKVQYALPYDVLHLNEKKARLYRGKLKHLEELNNQDFPLEYVNEEEYQSSSQSSSYAGYAHVKKF